MTLLTSFMSGSLSFGSYWEMSMGSWMITLARPGKRSRVWGGRINMVIKNKSAPYIDEFSSHSGEKEVLIPSGTKLKCTAIKKDAEMYGTLYDYIFYFEEV